MTREQAINTWEPIMTNMGYNGNKLGDICVYANKHTAIKKANGGMLLPMSIKLLTMIKSLDLPNVTFTSDNNDNVITAINRDGLLNSILTDEAYEPITNEYIVETAISKDMIMELSAVKGIDIVQEMESRLLNLAAEKIDSEIIALGDNEITFNTSRLTKDIGVSAGSDSNPLTTMVLTLSYTIKINK